ncbi:MAG: copper amine oxidase N-terminal domain-containing protein [Firmicutes bacterium]|nr:copper amine oxidase N-terminal domain-containing protein [Bacillota bacterium]
MSKRCRRILIMLFTVLLAVSLLTGFGAAEGTEKKTVTYPEIPLYVEGIRAGSGFMVNNITYVSLRVFCEAIVPEITVSWDESSQTATAQMPDLLITAQVGAVYLEVNGRCFYTPSGVIQYDGSVCVPIDALAKAFTADVFPNDEYKIIDIGLDNMAPAVPADQYYNADDLYWLSRVINSEAGNQPLTGKIGVGAVVINRVNTHFLCNGTTIKDAIFYAGQFDVVPTGAINMSPNAESVLAAKLCLDGANTVGNSNSYLNPIIGSAVWAVPPNFVVSIGDHDFYDV